MATSYGHLWVITWMAMVSSRKLAPGGSAGRSKNLQGGVQEAPEREDSGPAVPDRRARLRDQRISFATEVALVARS